METMSLKKAIYYARQNTIVPIGRNSISRFASVIVCGKTEIIGFNQYRSHPLQFRFSTNDDCVYLHSEVDAIRKTIQYLARQNGSSYRDITDLSDWNMFVARVLKDGSPAMAKPCIGCQRAIMHFNIQHIEWTT